MNTWPYAEKTWTRKWWLGVAAWFAGPRLIITIAVLAIIEQVGGLW